MLSFLTILATLIMGFAGAPLWAILVGGAILTLSALWERRSYRFNFPNIGNPKVAVISTFLLSPLGFGFAAICFGTGRGLALLL